MTRSSPQPGKPSRRSSGLLLALGALVVCVVASCAPRPNMCAASSECAQSACVAGRCQPSTEGTRPAVDLSRRVVVRPADMAYVRRGDTVTDGALPPLVVLGRDGALLLFRFSVALPPSAKVVEAYLVLHRAAAVDDDPAPVSLHATRIVERWDGRSTTFAMRPKLQDGRSPTTVVRASGPALVRVDVRDLVRNWAKHDPADQGLAVLASGESGTGMAFAIRERDRAADRADSERQSFADDVEPFLELYVR